VDHSVAPHHNERGDGGVKNSAQILAKRVIARSVNALYLKASLAK
jgi:hypothetical protein